MSLSSIISPPPLIWAVIGRVIFPVLRVEGTGLCAVSTQELVEAQLTMWSVRWWYLRFAAPPRLRPFWENPVHFSCLLHFSFSIELNWCITYVWRVSFPSLSHSSDSWCFGHFKTGYTNKLDLVWRTESLRFYRLQLVTLLHFTLFIIERGR